MLMDSGINQTALFSKAIILQGTLQIKNWPELFKIFNYKRHKFNLILLILIKHKVTVKENKIYQVSPNGHSTKLSYWLWGLGRRRV